MPKTYYTEFPFDKNLFQITLFEWGNAPDYSFLYPPGTPAGHGESEGYSIRNCPKDQPNPVIQVTGNPGTDMMKFNYIRIDYGNTGDGTKYYFVDNKTLINYPEIDQGSGSQHWYCVEYHLRQDYWETIKDNIGNPLITLSQVTTASPGSWDDITALENGVPGFSGTIVSTTPINYTNWKTIIGWQAKRPSEQDNYVIDGMATTLQWEEGEDMSNYLEALEDLGSLSPEETNIFNSYIACNSYIVSDYFTTQNGGSSQNELLTLANPQTTQAHARLNYYPYRRAFLETIDGQSVELDYRKYDNNKMPDTILASVIHSTVPSPTSTIIPSYPQLSPQDMIVFSAYPSMDFTGKNITPVTQLTSWVKTTQQANQKAYDEFAERVRNGY